MSKRVAVLLSGCGHQDGAEIHESTCALLALDRAGATYTGFAPNHNQAKVVNHLDGSAMNESRNIMIEAGRIMRGNVKPITELNVDDFDALVMPGGFGAALNYCNYGTAGRNCEIDKDVKRVITGFVKAGKPVGAICISPVALAKSLEGSEIHPLITIGTDTKTAEDVESMGAKHQNCAVEDIVVDKENKIVTTPAYMLAERIGEVNAGVSKLVDEVLKLI